MTSNFPTPILFLIFNRVDNAEIVFEAIRKIKPAKLFVSADGPRENKHGEKEKCIVTRKIIENIDWECELKTNFSDINLGCKKAVSGGINWFFENVEEGIILEDDCLPDISFFTFCKELLGRYKDKEDIMHIGGLNLQDGNIRGDGSYYLSKYAFIWGWATWRRAWKKYEPGMKGYTEFLSSGGLQKIFPDKKMQKHWKRNFDSVYYNKKDTWDFQWNYSIWKNKGLCISPNVNMITNLGFGNDASHTNSGYTPLSGLKRQELVNIIHPSGKEVSIEADEYTFEKYFYNSIPKKILIKSRSFFK